jgi:hypothetical protein
LNQWRIVEFYFGELGVELVWRKLLMGLFEAVACRAFMKFKIATAMNATKRQATTHAVNFVTENNFFGSFISVKQHRSGNSVVGIRLRR